jgi:hypothetical protein
MTFSPATANQEKDSNKAVSIKILKISSVSEISGKQAGKDHAFFILETEWENIHPKQKVEKDKLEGKTDRTMGVSTLAGKKKKETEYVEADVAYKIGKIYDHVYILADGLAYPLHPITENIPEGVKLQTEFILAKQGEKRKAQFVCLLPENAQHIGFQFFDYKYGHVSIPVKGNLEEARGSGKPPGKVLGRIQSPVVEIAAHFVDIQQKYSGDVAPKGWQYVLVQLSGRSLSGRTVKDIVQIEPKEYTWITTEGNYLYYASGGSTTEGGMIRFTPEVFQHQEIAFLIPSSARVAQLGIRLRNDVFHLKLTDTKPEEMPEAIATHRDGDVMEVKLFGTRKEEGRVILDIGIQSLETSGIEIQRKAQFQLVVNDKKISMDDSATDQLFHTCQSSPPAFNMARVA